MTTVGNSSERGRYWPFWRPMGTATIASVALQSIGFFVRPEQWGQIVSHYNVSPVSAIAELAGIYSALPLVVATVIGIRNVFAWALNLFRRAR